MRCLTFLKIKPSKKVLAKNSILFGKKLKGNKLVCQLKRQKKYVRKLKLKVQDAWTAYSIPLILLLFYKVWTINWFFGINIYIRQVSKDTNESIDQCKILQSNLYIPNWLFQGKGLCRDQGNKNRERMEGLTPLGLRKTRIDIPVTKEKK